MCALIGRILIRTTGLGTGGFHRLLQLGNNLSIAEHEYHGTAERLPADFELKGAILLAVRPVGSTQTQSTVNCVRSGDRLIICAHDDVHQSLVL